jgi:hypothetical protein
MIFGDKEDVGDIVAMKFVIPGFINPANYGSSNSFRE